MDEYGELTLDEAREINDNYEIGDVVELKITPRDFGRIAAQTAKQVVVQRIREAERGIIYDDFVNRQSEIATGIVPVSYTHLSASLYLSESGLQAQ